MQKKRSTTTFIPFHLLSVKINMGGKAYSRFPEHYNTAILIVEGSIKVNDSEEIKTDSLGLLFIMGINFNLEVTVLRKSLF